MQEVGSVSAVVELGGRFLKPPLFLLFISIPDQCCSFAALSDRSSAESAEFASTNSPDRRFRETPAYGNIVQTLSDGLIPLNGYGSRGRRGWRMATILDSYRNASPCWPGQDLSGPYRGFYERPVAAEP